MLKSCTRPPLRWRRSLRRLPSVYAGPYVDTREELVVHKSGVNPAVRRGGGGGHGGGHGGVGLRGSGGVDPGVVIPVYMRSHRAPRTHYGHNNGEHNLPHLVSTILALIILLINCC
ncbi:hypothetical protein L1987_81807 [Smallanthus sonchifolius]|uniref:Uncharacterized protein n=1 Tax=Smallanthus sonchifolius TaxID=185202 RepID=A0ACB8YRW7_9ASTR|nr:hypothetical protein L1987_81807 [Smallanthus sonchifolius]